MATRRDGLSARREALGHTQETLAQKLDVEFSTVGRWERGTLTPQPWRRRALADALQVSLDQLNTLLNPTVAPSTSGELATSRRTVVADAALLTGAVVAERWIDYNAWQLGVDATGTVQFPVSHGTPQDRTEHVRTTATLIDDLHRRYQATRYGDVARTLPALTDTVGALVADGTSDQRREASALQCSMEIVAAKLATKVGDGPAAHAAAERARLAAEAADDVFGQVAAAYELTLSLLRLGRSEEAEQTAVIVAATIHGSDPQSLTWRGNLTLISSIIAARRDDATEARRRLDHAEHLATRLGGDANIGFTAFGPTNVQIHRMSAAVALDDPYGVLAIGEHLDVTAMPVGLNGRCARLHLDSAWAHIHLDDDPLALIHLLETERIAPELVRTYPTARALIEDLLARKRRRMIPALRGLAHRAGVWV
ncbi:MAG: helix-turn-helix domain-containing protein [Pseudonocardia sp.]